MDACIALGLGAMVCGPITPEAAAQQFPAPFFFQNGANPYPVCVQVPSVFLSGAPCIPFGSVDIMSRKFTFSGMNPAANQTGPGNQFVIGTDINGNLTYGPIPNSAIPNPLVISDLQVLASASGAGLTAFMASPPAIGSTAPSTGAFTSLSASGTVSGTGFSSYLAAPPPIGNVTPSTGAFTALSASGTVSGAGFTTFMASPPAIGSTAPSTGTFTTLSASGTVSGTGFSSYLAAPPPIGSVTPSTGTFTTLSATNGTFNGPVYATPTGAPFAADMRMQEADENPLRAWGFIGNGSSNPLSSIASVNGTSTSGWTLGQWQAKLPCVTSLSDEIDWAALQCYANSLYSAGAANLLRIKLPGTPYTNKPLGVCGQVYIQGPYEQKGSFWYSSGAGTDVIRFCQDGQTASDKSLTIERLRPFCANAGGCGHILTATFTGGTYGRLTMRDVFTQETDTGQWSGGLYLTDVTLSQTYNVNLTNKAGVGGLWAGNCINIVSTALFNASDIRMDRPTCSKWQTAINLDASAAGANVEGLRISHGDFYARDWIIYTTSGATLNQIVLDDMQGTVYRSIFSTSGATGNSVSGFVFTNSWLGLNVADAHSGAYAPATNGLIDWTKVQGGVHSNTWVFGNTDATKYIAFGPTVSGGFNIVQNNTFVAGTPPTTAWLYYTTGSGGSFDQDNQYFSGTPVAFQTLSDRRYNGSDGYAAFASAGKCGLVRGQHVPGIAGSEYGVMECEGSGSGTTNASGQLSFTYTPAFIAGARYGNPVPVITSGSGCVNAPVVTTSSITGFTAQWTGCATTAVTIEWRVRGE